MQRSSFQLSRWLAMLLTLLGLLGTAWHTSASLEITPTNPVVGQVVTAIYTLQRCQVHPDFLGRRLPKKIVPNGVGSARHTYSAAGTFTIVVFAKDSVAVFKRITVSEATTCEISADPNPATPKQTVNFTIKFTGPADSKYGLSYGDGTNDNFSVGRSKSVSFKHAYSQADTAVVGVTDLATQGLLCRLVVNVTSPSITISLDPSPANVGQQVTATLSNLASNQTYTLNWGDGTTSPVSGTTTNVKHSYGSSGVYLVQLLRDGTLATASITIRAPAPTVSVDPNPALVGQTVTASLDNLAIETNYDFDWGDGTTQMVGSNTGKATAKHVYTSPGTYLIRLTQDGQPAATASITIRAPASTLSVDPNPAPPCKTSRPVWATCSPA